jgi:hypothetical protein
MKKIYYMGRDITGKFSRETFINKITRKAQAMWYWTKIVMGIGLGGAMVGGLIVGLSIGSITKYTKAEEVHVPVYVDTMPQKIEALKDEVVKDLESCESAGHTEDDAIVILDNNKAGTLKRKDIPSFGVLQFKVSTVQHYKKLIDGEVLTNKQAVLLALEAAEARELAKSIIFETDGGIQNWVNCSNKHGLVDKVRIIKAIIK